MRIAPPVSLKAEDRKILEAWVARANQEEDEDENRLKLRRASLFLGAKRVRLRAEIVLCAGYGLTNRQVASKLGIEQKTVARWRARYQDGGLDGLKDKWKPGRPHVGQSNAAHIKARAKQERARAKQERARAKQVRHLKLETELKAELKAAFEAPVKQGRARAFTPEPLPEEVYKSDAWWHKRQYGED